MTELYRTRRVVHGVTRQIIVIDEIVPATMIDSIDRDRLGSVQTSMVRQCADVLLDHHRGISIHEVARMLDMTRLSLVNERTLQVSYALSKLSIPLVVAHDGYRPRLGVLASAQKVPLEDRVYRIYRYVVIPEEGDSVFRQQHQV